MKTKINLMSTGISLIDYAWGGFYRGGSYLMLGPKKSGKSILGLQFARESIENKEVCLYFTGMRPKDITILAASIDFDIQQHMNDNELIVVKVAAPADLYEMGNPDSFLQEYFNDIIAVVEQYQPDRLIFDELTPFVGFEDMENLQQSFLKSLEAIEDKNITSLFILAEPATQFAQNIVDTIAQYSTAILYLQKHPAGEVPVQGGRCTITPNIGHTEGQFLCDYRIEPYKGVIFDFDEDDEGFENAYAINRKTEEEQEIEIPEKPPAKMPAYKKSKKVEPKISGTVPENFKPLAQVETVADPLAFSNLYDLNEFTLILNNQIALFKSTGQEFTLITLKLDQKAIQDNLLRISQLKNVVRLSSDKKDKLCLVDDTMLVLLSKTDPKALNMLAGKIRNNLPAIDDNELADIMNLIYANVYVPDSSVENAEVLLKNVIK